MSMPKQNLVKPAPVMPLSSALVNPNSVHQCQDAPSHTEAHIGARIATKLAQSNRAAFEMIPS